MAYNPQRLLLSRMLRCLYLRRLITFHLCALNDLRVWQVIRKLSSTAAGHGSKRLRQGWIVYKATSPQPI